MVSEDQLLSRDGFSGEISERQFKAPVLTLVTNNSSGVWGQWGDLISFSPKGVHAMKTETLKTRSFSKHQ